jgi:oligosaccharide repeat unit polymerase
MSDSEISKTKANMVKHQISSAVARNSGQSTAVLICGLGLTSIMLPSEGAVAIFAAAAYGVGVSLGLATVMEAISGVRNLIRVDLLMLWALYGLTLLEFLLPQPDVDSLVSVDAARNGTYAVLLGFAGLGIGRHLIPWRRRHRQDISMGDIRPSDLFLFFVLAAVLGYFHILFSVNFDVFEALRQMMLPRFAQSWGRGKYGDAYALLHELGMLIYLIPPIAGLIYARSREFSFAQKAIVSIILLVTMYYGFSTGTRNVLATYVITFMGAYFLAKPRLKLSKVLLIGVPVAAVLLLLTTYMLAFRSVGLARFSLEEHQSEGFFIDRNIVIISNLTQVFPGSFDFLGLEIPFNALIRPVPRVLWPDKPEGLSVSIESAIGADYGTTVSCTFVGEAYMSGGFFAVFFFALLFGAAAELWNRVGRNIGSSFAQLLYASGFLCAAIAMRSMLSMVPLMLPTLALWLYGRFWVSAARARRLPPRMNPSK